MRNEKRVARAREIEDAAYRILEIQGYDGMSVQAVAREAKASNETIYRWYGDKTGLFKALIRSNAAQVATALDSDTADPLKTLAELGPILLSMVLGPRAIALNRAAAADGSGTLGQVLAREGRETIRPKVLCIMTRAVEDNQLSGQAEKLTETWIALLIGDLQIRRVTGALPTPSRVSVAARAEDALHHLKQLFPPA